jgi:SAM-dependent methyltransferase
MLSDGRIWREPLTKSVCLTCGGVTSTEMITDVSIRSFYDADYSLGAAPGASDLLRNEAYADLVADFIRSCSAQRILEVGSGSGHVLVRLADQLPESELVGLEAAAQLSSRPVDRQAVTIHHGFVEDLPPATTPFDFVYCINVIEHAADPINFLQALRRQLTPDGQALVICPAVRPANLELVFKDHVSSFTTAAFISIAARAGFQILTLIPELSNFPGFQAFLLKSTGTLTVKSKSGSLDNDTERAIEVAEYLQSWKDLDETLMIRIGPSSKTRVFGAGEMAALLRCYAPRFWQTVQAVVIDDLAGCRNLGPPIVRADSLQSDVTPLVLAVHPRLQNVLSKRFRNAGFRTVQFDDQIPQ